jgi:hypothetical protein
MSSKSKPNIKDVQKVILESSPSEPDSDVRVDLERERLEIERLRTDLNSLKNDITARKVYVGLTYFLVIVWLGLIIWIIIATGSGWYKLSDTVLVALITTTTLNVLGLFLVVTQYLFPKKS